MGDGNLAEFHAKVLDLLAEGRRVTSAPGLSTRENGETAVARERISELETSSQSRSKRSICSGGRPAQEAIAVTSGATDHYGSARCVTPC